MNLLFIILYFFNPNFAARAETPNLADLLKTIKTLPKGEAGDAKRSELISQAYNLDVLKGADPAEFYEYIDFYLDDFQRQVQEGLRAGRIPEFGKLTRALENLPRGGNGRALFSSVTEKKFTDFRNEVYLPLVIRRLCSDLVTGRLPPASLLKNGEMRRLSEYYADTPHGQDFLRVLLGVAEIAKKKGQGEWADQLVIHPNSESPFKDADLLAEEITNPLFPLQHELKIPPGARPLDTAYRVKKVLFDPATKDTQRVNAMRFLEDTPGVLTDEDLAELQHVAWDVSRDADINHSVTSFLLHYKNTQANNSVVNFRASIKAGLPLGAYFQALESDNFKIREGAEQRLLDFPLSRRSEMTQYIEKNWDTFGPEAQVRSMRLLNVFRPDSPINYKKICERFEPTVDPGTAGHSF